MYLPIIVKKLPFTVFLLDMCITCLLWFTGIKVLHCGHLAILAWASVKSLIKLPVRFDCLWLLFRFHSCRVLQPGMHNFHLHAWSGDSSPPLSFSLWSLMLPWQRGVQSQNQCILVVDTNFWVDVAPDKLTHYKHSWLTFCCLFSLLPSMDFSLGTVKGYLSALSTFFVVARSTFVVQIAYFWRVCNICFRQSPLWCLSGTWTLSRFEVHPVWAAAQLSFETSDIEKSFSSL